MKQSTNHSSDIHTSHSKQDDETSNNLYGIESGMSVEFIVLPGAGLFGQQHCMESTSMPAQHRQQHAMSCNLLINALHTTKDGRRYHVLLRAFSTTSMSPHQALTHPTRSSPNLDDLDCSSDSAGKWERSALANGLQVGHPIIFMLGQR